MHRGTHPHVTDEMVRALREETGAHERSILRRLAGLPVRGACGVAIDRALAAHGLVRHGSSPPEASR